MMSEKFAAFRDMVLADIGLQDKLRAPLDRDEFVRTASSLAAERGLGLTDDDIEEALRAGRRDWIERWI